MCFPAYIVGILFIALLIFDIVKKDYSSVPRHGIIGVCLTVILWILCVLVGESISMGVLIVPLIFGIIFLFSVWFMNESFKKRGCCMNCSGDSPKTGSCRIVKREKPSDSCAPKVPEKPVDPPPKPSCIAKLTATPL
jgi:hypothetical protein